MLAETTDLTQPYPSYTQTSPLIVVVVPAVGLFGKFCAILVSRYVNVTVPDPAVTSYTFFDPGEYCVTVNPGVNVAVFVNGI